jgi:myo-inositol-1(or 4)-monophosphatase
LDRLQWTRTLAKTAGLLSISMHTELGAIDMKKDHRDLVTRADKAVEELIVLAIKETFPTHSILGEEYGATDLLGSDGYVWVIDPIDGTTNYVHGLGYYGISIALTKYGRGILGVVYNPITGEMFAAEKGGAVVFGTDRATPISLSPSRTTSLQDSLISTAMFWDDPVTKGGLHPKIVELAKLTRGIRMHACASLDLCMVACGRLDAYIMPMLSPWDFAAGVIILEAVGGIATDLRGNDLDLTKGSSLLATPSQMHGQFVDFFKGELS